jgi:hypothetical protein
MFKYYKNSKLGNSKKLANEKNNIKVFTLYTIPYENITHVYTRILRLTLFNDFIRI